MKTLAVLMWKHMVVRRKRYIHTPIEIISTIVFFVILYVFINDQSSSKADWSTSFSKRSAEPLSITSAEGPQRIFYTPKNNLTNLIMEKVGKRLSMQPQHVITDDMTFGKYYTALKNESDYQKYAYHDMSNDAVVIFQEISSTVPAKEGKLNYTIRMKGDFNVESYDAKSPVEQFMPHSNYGKTYESFMKLQWAIDSSYLELLTGHDIPLKLTLQEFPYVKQRSSEMVALVCAMMTIVCWLSLLLVFVFLVTRLAEERLNGIQELIRMVGVSQMLVNISHALNVVPAGLVFSVVGTTLLAVSKRPMIPTTNPIYIFAALALYFATVVSQAFAVSYLVRNQQYTVTIASVSYIAMELPMDFLKLWHKMPKALVLPSGLLPHIPLSWFWEELAAAEESGKGITMGNFTKASSTSSGSVLACYVMMMIQCAVFSMLTWYLSLVMPGPYGQALPWKFLCQRSTKKLPTEESEELEENDAINPHYFEAPPHDAVAGIKVANVSKKFGKHRALRNVSMDVYKGEITVLLGHNGAGKTTLMSIITGMYGATEGNIYVEGLDTVRKKDKMRKLLGLCPQHNLFFPDLTVLQHVMFFSMLKGIPYKQAKQSSMELLQQVLIADKASFNRSQLSGGMKRRLQLACALAGNSRVLVLDEPTSGLDVETRRGLWDLLLSLRGSRTVLISTHFMEEAEAIGDRVAALHAGRLRCHATTMYLKRALGTGYRLSLNTKGMPHEPSITAAVTSNVPNATVNEISLNAISYNLPSKDTAKFPNLFNLLESKKSELGIENIGVGVSTLEEVFLQLGSDVTTTFSDEENRMISEPAYVKLSGIRLYTRQLMLLFQRQYKYILSIILPFLLLQVAFPIIAISLLVIITNGGDTTTRSMNTPLSLELDMYNTPDRRVLYNVNSSEAILRGMRNKYPGVDFQGVPNIIDVIIRSGKQSKQEYYTYLARIEFHESDAKVLYTALVRHAAPMALNLLSNMIATHMLPHSNGNTITTLNYPLRADLYMRSNKPSKSPENCIFWSISIVFQWWTMFKLLQVLSGNDHPGMMMIFSLPAVFLITLISFVSLPCKERVTSTRRIHVMTGCPPVLHWTATLLTHFVLAVTVLLTPAILSAAFLDKDDTINQSNFLGIIALVILLGILSFLSLVYLVSFTFEERGATIILVALGLIFCIVTPLLAIVHTLAPEKSKGLMYYSLILISFILPPHTFQLAVYQSVITAKSNAKWGPVDCYMCFESFAPLSNMLKLLLQFVSYMKQAQIHSFNSQTMVVLTEHGVFNSIFDRIFNYRYKPASADAAYEMVRAEKAYVDRTITLPKQQIQDAMLASNLHKRYRSFCGKSFTAVRGVDFSVKRGECFGLLGVNGAGKSSTFKMLTGIECTTRGTIYANGHFNSKFSSKYLQSLGYCPQFFGLDDFLSGHDNLTLLLTLRGLSPQDVQTEASTWIEIVGLEKYALRPVSGYSGGCARRLAAAAALSCGGAVTLLDEPTAGVDVAARRRVWAAVRRAIRSQRSIIITSHSLDEIEALCARIAIMVAGRIVTLGSAGALRAAHASGHAVQLKLFAITGAKGTNSSQSDVERLKAAMAKKFDCTLRDEHRTMLHYHINVTMRYSELFTAMEGLRAQFPNVLEDYTITETTLEEVFLSFAR